VYSQASARLRSVVQIHAFELANSTALLTTLLMERLVVRGNPRVSLMYRIFSLGNRTIDKWKLPVSDFWCLDTIQFFLLVWATSQSRQIL
jgi:hypothetical protein